MTRTDPHAQLVAFWCDRYHQHVGAKYPFNGGKDGNTIKWLRGIYGDDEIRTYMSAFFELEDDFIQQSGYGLGVFRGCLPKVIQFVKRGPKSKTTENLTGIAEWLAERKASNE